MRYYKLIYDYENDDKSIFCDIANIGNMSEYIVQDGKTIDNWENVIFEYNSQDGNIFTDYLSNVYSWLVVSDKFKRVTNDLISDHVQYLPLKIIERNTGVEIDTYSVLNILSIVDALDLEHSVYDIFELDNEKIISIQKYALQKNKILDQHIFRLENQEIGIFVSEALKEVIESEHLLGFSFLEVYVS